MGEINLARVDDRLIHGQVMTKWSRGLNTNAIFVVDNPTAKDPFMKEVYIMSTASSGMTIKVFSTDEVVEYWNKTKFENYRAILLFKNIDTVNEVVEKGLPITRLNIGGIAKTKEAKFVIPSVGLKPSDAEILKSLASKGIEVFFQTVPDTKAVTLQDALKNF
ncbi:PTS system mannose/fructose/N-acetylgalactosamine-transporter subunit IIB [Fonticella tunisiensis]|uniref:PTS system mannose-specific IIB component n=1 Tax=Fonticella tunisiensis TaxID=1096341 RepID=A0A4R7KAB6_9CLOT|nr:PTS sugar transporter subunit IIB [Fonticella tunisiensis]TDT51304.1 PTS system mannose-specific IIB component [Fonticella tunisiensis]